MDTHDTIGRRKKTKRQPLQKVEIRPRDLIVLQALQTHGALPSPYLFALTKHIGSCKTYFIERLNQLYHAGYLSFPEGQLDMAYAHCNYHIYDLDEKGVETLKEYDLYKNTNPPTGHFKHKTMVSCLTASIELATYGTDITYIPQHEITDTLEIPTVIDGERHNLVPDAVFGLEYSTKEGSKYLFFCLEADRNTEPLTGKTNARKTFKRSVDQYRELIGKGQYKKHFNLTAGMLCLHVTTKPSRMQEMVKIVERSSASNKNSFMLFQVAEEFGIPFRPKQPLTSLFTGEWHLAGYPPRFIDRL